MGIGSNFMFWIVLFLNMLRMLFLLCTNEEKKAVRKSMYQIPVLEFLFF